MQTADLLVHPTSRLINGNLIASILPSHLMGSHTGPSAAWNNEGDDCVICISEMVGGDEVSEIPTCHHTFHLECLTKWLETKVAAVETGRCPVCNNVVISPVRYATPPQPQLVTPPQPQFVTLPQVTPQTRLLTQYSCNSIAKMIYVVLTISSLVLVITSLVLLVE